MKKISLTLIAVIAMMQFSFAQWSTNAGNTITSTTNLIGIGTTTPRSSLDVGGGVQISGVTSATPNNNGLVYGLFPYQGVGLGIYSAASSPNQGIGIWTNPNGTPTEVMRVLSGGNVGIGTTMPTAPLNVQGGSITTGLANIAGTLTTRFNTANPPVTLGIGYVSSDNPFLQAFNSTNNTANNLIMNPFGGNVLIGQSSQRNTSYLLDVSGTIRAKGIIVNTDGADFVFDPSYKLNTLPALKDYIDKNHHLPEIASAQEMQKDGLNVGENQVKLLQKVEELTLYMIEKDKQLNDEKDIIGKQQQEIDQLKQQMQQLITEVKQSKTNN